MEFSSNNWGDDPNNTKSQANPTGQPDYMNQEPQINNPGTGGTNYAAPGGDPSPTNGMAVASLVLGIASLLACFAGVGAIVGLVLGIVGLVLAINAKKKMPTVQSGLATAGMVCSIIGLVISGVVFLSCVLCIGFIGSGALGVGSELANEFFTSPSVF